MSRPAQDRFQTKAERAAEWLDAILNMRVDGLVPVALVVGAALGAFIVYQWFRPRVVTVALLGVLGIYGCVSPSAPATTHVVTQQVMVECSAAPRVCSQHVVSGRVTVRDTVDQVNPNFPLAFSILGVTEDSANGNPIGIILYVNLQNVSSGCVGTANIGCVSDGFGVRLVLAASAYKDNSGSSPPSLANRTGKDSANGHWPYQQIDNNALQPGAYLINPAVIQSVGWRVVATQVPITVTDQTSAFTLYLVLQFEEPSSGAMSAEPVELQPFNQ